MEIKRILEMMLDAVLDDFGAKMSQNARRAHESTVLTLRADVSGPKRGAKVTRLIFACYPRSTHGNVSFSATPHFR